MLHDKNANREAQRRLLLITSQRRHFQIEPKSTARLSAQTESERHPKRGLKADTAQKEKNANLELKVSKTLPACLRLHACISVRPASEEESSGAGQEILGYGKELVSHTESRRHTCIMHAEGEGTAGGYKKHAEIFAVAHTVRHWHTVALPARLLLNRAGQVTFQTGINIRGEKSKHTEKTHTHRHTRGTVSSCINRPDLPLFVPPPPRGAGGRRRCRTALKNRVSGFPICCSAPPPSDKSRSGGRKNERKKKNASHR